MLLFLRGAFIAFASDRLARPGERGKGFFFPGAFRILFFFGTFQGKGEREADSSDGFTIRPWDLEERVYALGFSDEREKKTSFFRPLWKEGHSELHARSTRIPSHTHSRHVLRRGIYWLSSFA